MRIQLAIILCAMAAIAAGQEISHPIKYYVSPDGKIYWNKNLPVYLRIGSSATDEGVLLKSENHAKYTNPLYLDTEGVNFVRTQWAVDTATRRAVTPQIEIMMEVYSDSQAPKNEAIISTAPMKQREGVTYYGKGLTIGMTASDEMSGVEKMFMKVNGGGYSVFQQPIAFNTEGQFTVNYYSLDNVGNFSTPAELNFVVDLQAPNTYHNINGLAIDRVITTSTKIYFTREDSLSGVAKTYYKFDNEEFRLYDGKALVTGQLSEGEHVLTYYSVDQVNNTEEEKRFEFYFDKTAPIMAADILGDRFITEEQVYFSGRTKLKLTAVDNKVGVKEIWYSINNEPYKPYDQPFYLPSVSGVHTVRYYSVDNLGNESQPDSKSSSMEFKHAVNKVYVDLTGPNMGHTLVGKSYASRDTIFINRETKILLKGNDPESGIGRLTYSVDGTMEESEYTEPFTIPNKGYHLIDYFGYDNVNNRNVSRFFIFSDHDGPAVFHNFSTAPYEIKNGLNVYPADITLYLAATDDKVGLANIFYKINDKGEFQPYLGKVNPFKKNTKYSVTIKAVDYLGNETLSEVEFYTGK